jgi:thiamine-monophosphate kinase
MSASALRPHQALGAGREFALVRAMVERWGPVAADIGDDAAVLPPPPPGMVRVISTDSCVEGVHFRPAWLTPDEVGARAAAAALSDLAAMGAHPEFVLLALTLPHAWDDAALALADGVGRVVASVGARIVGGNITRGAQLLLTTTVVGAAVRPVPRGGARPGDLVVVTGALGGPGRALRALMAGGTPDPWARERFAGPRPRCHEGARLAAAGATAMIDLSDGLVADAGHLAAASGVALRLDPARLPCGPGITPQEALDSGEEYELLATLPPGALAVLRASERAGDAPVTVVGIVAEGTGVQLEGRAAAQGGAPAAPGGFDHLG